MELARSILSVVRRGVKDSFNVLDRGFQSLEVLDNNQKGGAVTGTIGDMAVLADADFLRFEKSTAGPYKCTLKGKIYKAVDSNFAEDAPVAPVSTLAQPHPPEIAMPLDRFRTKFPDPKKTGFLIMRFAAEKPYANIVSAIKNAGKELGLEIIRADENEFHSDLFNNVRTHLHGCGFGIAIYERISTDEPNANVGLEVGYLMAMGKPVLLLKDKTLEVLQTDLAGKLYKTFDPHDPDGTIPDQLNKWLEGYGIVVPERLKPEN